MQFYVCYLSVPGSCHIILANIKITSAPINAKFFVYSSHAEFIINGSVCCFMARNISSADIFE